MLIANTIFVRVTDIKSNASWIATGVYGPQGDLEKRMFLWELKQAKRSIQSPWMLIGDFNLTYKAQDKSNGHLNQRMMMTFRRVLDYLETKKLELMRRRFTWSNNQSNPTMTHIDRVFCTPDWEGLYPRPMLQPLSSSSSHHYPIIVVPSISPYIKHKFHFESHWAHMHGFTECF
jgi:endonuclease/exonuclease/phosphatase family metal-dependent hydrolase